MLVTQVSEWEIHLVMKPAEALFLSRALRAADGNETGADSELSIFFFESAASALELAVYAESLREYGNPTLQEWQKETELPKPENSDFVSQFNRLPPETQRDIAAKIRASMRREGAIQEPGEAAPEDEGAQQQREEAHTNA